MTVKIFFCYAHEDEALLNILKRHLSPLRRQGLIDVWYDRDISAGTEWEQEISQHLNLAQIILLLVSPDFMDSDYCYSIEMKRALKRYEAGEARVIPIILHPVDWQNAPFGKLQVLPKDGKPVTRWRNRADAFLEVAMGIRDIIKDLQANPSYATTASPRIIIGIPPPTDPSTIQQREQAVKEVYAKLNQPNITAIVLTGIGGLGKSTLAALVYRYAEIQRLADKGPFDAEAIWLKIDDAVTMTDLGGTLLEALGKPLPEFGQFDPPNQALALFHALNTTEKTRLIVLDQFENLLDWQTGRALANRSGIGEWLNILNSEICRCRMVLTSRSRPQGTQFYPQTCVQEYPVKGLNFEEGTDLLRKQGVTETQATEEDLRTAVDCCEGHALALTLLATILHDHNLRLITLLRDATYEQLWTGDIASHLLDYIYTRQLDELQRKLLLAFSVFREAVPLTAVETLIDLGTKISKAQMQSALRALLGHHLLQATGEGRYQLHVIVCSYAQSHFAKDDVQANQQATHAKAAQYYLQQAAESCPPRDKRRGIKDVQPWIEAIWQYCQAEQWQEAYNLIQQEGILHDVHIWGGYDNLLELCQPLLLPGRSPLKRSQAGWIYYYLGWVYYGQGKYEQSYRHYEQALQISKEVGDIGLEGNSLDGLGSVYGARGKNEEGLKYYEQALQISRKVKDRGLEGRILNNLGYTYKALSKHKDALKYFEEALPIRKEIKDQDGESRTLNGLGSVYRVLDKKEEALKFYTEALLICREIGNRPWEATSLHNIGKLYFQQRRYDTALACFLLTRNICEEILGPGRDKVQKWIDTLHRKVGEPRFAALLARVEPQASQIVDQALRKRTE